jgi:hypothetical protein
LAVDLEAEAALGLEHLAMGHPLFRDVFVVEAAQNRSEKVLGALRRGVDQLTLSEVRWGGARNR